MTFYMDLLTVIQRQIQTLPEGPYLAGLQSVLRHIETAYRHLSRGQTDHDESAFTDAVYRTNQAFEGSIKEAYRVLADRDPAHMRPYDIEQYLQTNGVFRPRVLTQFTGYRQEWRNPSTHDYTLDFDEDEAFLAIVSVSAFTKLLSDQIAERIAYNAVEAQTRPLVESLQNSVPSNVPLVERVAATIATFLSRTSEDGNSTPLENEFQLSGALSAYVVATLQESTVRTEVPLHSGARNYADMIIEAGDERVVIELKRASPRAVAHGLRKLQSVMLASDSDGGLLVLYTPESVPYRTDFEHSISDSLRIGVIEPAT